MPLHPLVTLARLCYSLGQQSCCVLPVSSSSGLQWRSAMQCYTATGCLAGCPLAQEMPQVASVSPLQAGVAAGKASAHFTTAMDKAATGLGKAAAEIGKVSCWPVAALRQ